MLAPSEIAALGAALAELDSPFTAGALRFLVLTGWRNGEALALRWENVDMEAGEALLPTTKTGRDRRTIGAAALEIVASLPRINRKPVRVRWRLWQGALVQDVARGIQAGVRAGRDRRRAAA